MVTGSSGTGKTQLLKYLIYQLREQDRASLIIDFKNDFASDSHFCDLSKLDRVFVNFDGLPFNPLIPYPLLHPGTGELVLHCGQHITGIASVLKKTYGLGAQQQHAVKNAISAAFQSAGLPTTGTMPYTKGINYPDFRLVGEFLEEQNVSAYNRVDELFTLDIFQEEHRNASFHELIDRGLVLDLSQIQSDLIKDTLAQLIVMSSHTYYNSQPQTGDLKQFVIFDEAHRVLTSEYMLRLVRECRAYGVGTILSSQYPSDFPADISASMATKIIHGNGGDADRVRAIINMLGAESMEGDVANLDRFECLIDNRHHPIKVVRTMNYPGHLIYSALLARNNQSRNELENVSGYDSSKLPIGNIVNRLENMGLITEKDGMISVLNGDED